MLWFCRKYIGTQGNTGKYKGIKENIGEYKIITREMFKWVDRLWNYIKLAYSYSGKLL
jgi:hypothetical protein